jgi:NAD(P)-dependent dehydrogenase (short-subunit alcohol dehydrogenase family)
MVEVFGATSTTEDVLSGVNLKGKRILVTGVSAGLGIETARSLAAHGAHVVGAARDLTKAEAATAEVRKAAAESGGGFELIELDLASFKSARAAADRLLAKKEPFDVVIANAGVMATPFGKTVDGFETQFGTNHLGHFLFVNRIASLIHQVTERCFLIGAALQVKDDSVHGLRVRNRSAVELCPCQWMHFGMHRDELSLVDRLRDSRRG